ncbi:hypothetical protein GCM10011501_07470 [Thalassotalea profundi]|uniref:Uncharacterized protein n=1 Tax=Thalassotalea profundi TaxID=2036687 RepID=A0ABQ3IFI3_9GAMM|nr:hypothetical protein GCM10011501_07470 [Thalassotalea profundi]
MQQDETLLCCLAERGSLTVDTNKPVIIAENMALIGRYIANIGPSNAYETVTESTPVSGVATKNEEVAGAEAPLLLNSVATGITPQEHKGKGAPISAAFTIAIFPEPKCLLNIALGTHDFINPAITNPSNNQGLASLAINRKFSKNKVNCGTIDRTLF